MIAAIRHTILILVGERAVENLTVVDDAVAVAVGRPFCNERVGWGDARICAWDVVPTNIPPQSSRWGAKMNAICIDPIANVVGFAFKPSSEIKSITVGPRPSPVWF